MKAIVVSELSKEYKVPEREEGLWRAFASVFNRRFRKILAVDRVSVEIAPGELVGFLGPNGAGKTTTMKMLSGLLHPSGGSVKVLGHDPYKREEAFQKRISMVMGHRNQLWWELPPQETFRLNKEVYGLSESEYRESLSELVDFLDLKDIMNVPIKKLSLGQRMKAELCASLLHRPKILLLDEPTLGLDVVMQKALRQFIRAYNARHGATVLLTSHNMGDVSELCDRVLIIHHGRILYDGALRQVVKRFAPTKLISAIFREPVDPAQLGRLGQVLSREELRAAIEVPREEVSARAAELLSRFPVEDLTIEELPIDEVIRRVFTGGAA